MVKIITNQDWCFLEIVIPTFNRGHKLKRLLSILEKEVNSIREDIKVKVTVSDNHSTDETQKILTQHSFRDNIVFRSNTKNIGALRNIWSLYETVRADYVWVISDDDIPKPGSLQKIIHILDRYKPTVLTFEFEQPPGDTTKRHGDRIGIEVFTDLQEAIPHILVLGKLTKQVFSASQFSIALNNMSFSKNTGYGWLLVILEIIKLASQKKIIVFHEFLAGCDREYKKLTEGLTPKYWDDYLLLLNHEIVVANCSLYVMQYMRGHSRYMIIMIYEVMAGVMQSSNNKIFREYGKQIPFNVGCLRNPFIGLMWISLRYGIPALPIVCRISEFPGRIKRVFFREGIN